VAKKSLKNSKHLVELIGSATLRAVALLSRVDKFAFLGVLDASKPEDVARSTLIDALSSVKPEAIAIADEEAVRLLQLARFRTEEMLEHAYTRLQVRFRSGSQIVPISQKGIKACGLFPCCQHPRI